MRAFAAWHDTELTDDRAGLSGVQIGPFLVLTVNSHIVFTAHMHACIRILNPAVPLLPASARKFSRLPTLRRVSRGRSC